MTVNTTGTGAIGDGAGVGRRGAWRLVAVLVLVASGVPDASAGAGARCATAVSPHRPALPVSAARLRAARAASRIRPQGVPASLQIDLIVGSELAANPDALAAFRRAADLWEAQFSDPILVSIEADLLDLGNDQVIGQAGSVALSGPHDMLTDAMMADALPDGDDAIVQSVPTAAQFAALLPVGFSLDGDLSGNKATLKALGFSDLDEDFGAVDATIEFNSRFAFDFDRSDGIGAGLTDFETVAAHEIGHALGFVSEVDLVDGAGPGPVAPSVLDLFRFGPGVQNPASPADFTSFARRLAPGGSGHFDDLDIEVELSTGVSGGDGNQASHWKDDFFGGGLLGLMDPTLAAEEVFALTNADVRAFDVIGWDTVGGVGSTTTTIPGTTTTTLPRPLTGKKLLLKYKSGKPDKAGMNLLSKDPASGLGADPGSADDPTVGGATIRIFSVVADESGDSFDQTYALAAGGWRYLKAKKPEKGYLLKQVAPFKKILVKPGKALKIVAKGATLPHALQGDPGDVRVVMTLGALTQCLEFGGQKNFKFGKKFLAKDAAAPGACPAPGGGSTTTTTSTTSTTDTTATTTTTTSLPPV
jgi:hypothetical protein